MKIYLRMFMILFIINLAPLSLQAATETRPALIKVGITGQKDLFKLLSLGLDVIEVKPNEYAKVLVTDQDLVIISEAGFGYAVIYSDMVAHLQAGLSGQMDMGGYHTLDEIYAALDSIYIEHPSIVTARDSIGYTVQGRGIFAVKISDNPTVDEDEPEVFFNSLTHAREPMGMEVLLYFMRYLTDNYGTDARVDSLVNNRELWFVPLVNPDGYQYNENTNPIGGGLWRKNRRNNGNGTFGVDLNRNYGYKWGYDNIGSSPNTSSQTYRGTGPFSEPETQGIRDFVLAHDFVITINYHTYSDLLLYPWGYIPYLPPDHTVFEDISQPATAVNGYFWGPGNSSIYPTNGDSDDWMYGEQVLKKKCLSFTPEVGGWEDGGFWPPDFFIPIHTVENLEANLVFAEKAGLYYKRSFRSARVEPDYILVVGLYGDTNTTYSLKLANIDLNQDLYFRAVSSETTGNWLSPEQEGVSRSLAPGDSVYIQLMFDQSSVSMNENLYTEVLLATHNDTVTSPEDSILVPLQFLVICSGLQVPGDANSDGNWTLADVIANVNYVFNKPGCSPVPLCWLSNLLCRGDWNASGSVTLGDAIQGVNYIFNKPGGPWKAVNTGACCVP